MKNKNLFWLVVLALLLSVAHWSVKVERSEFLAAVDALTQSDLKQSEPLNHIVSRNPASDVTLEYEDPIGAADAAIEQRKTELGLLPYHDLQPVVYHSPIQTLVKYSIYQDGIPIVGMNISVELDKDLQPINIVSNYRPLERAETKLSERPVREVAMNLPVRYKIKESSLTESEKSPVLFASANISKPQLAFLVGVVDRLGQKSPNKKLLVRAKDGEILRIVRARGEFHNHKDSRNPASAHNHQ